jgi:hypothetical protein
MHRYITHGDRIWELLLPLFAAVVNMIPHFCHGYGTTYSEMINHVRAALSPKTRVYWRWNEERALISVLLHNDGPEALIKVLEKALGATNVTPHMRKWLTKWGERKLKKAAAASTKEAKHATNVRKQARVARAAQEKERSAAAPKHVGGGKGSYFGTIATKLAGGAGKVGKATRVVKGGALSKAAEIALAARGRFEKGENGHWDCSVCGKVWVQLSSANKHVMLSGGTKDGEECRQAGASIREAAAVFAAAAIDGMADAPK